MYCYNCQYFNQCSYRNKLIPMPYYYSPSHSRVGSEMEEPPVEMSVLGDEEPDYIPPEPPGGTMNEDEIIRVIESCKSKWIYIWTKMGDDFWAKIVSHNDDSVTTKNHGKILYDRIRKISCPRPMELDQTPQENNEPLDEDEYASAERFYDNNCRNCYYYHACPAIMKTSHSSYFTQYYTF